MNFIETSVVTESQVRIAETLLPLPNLTNYEIKRGDRFDLAVRPENIKFVENYRNSLPVRITASEFLGAFFRVDCELQNELTRRSQSLLMYQWKQCKTSIFVSVMFAISSSRKPAYTAMPFHLRVKPSKKRWRRRCNMDAKTMTMNSLTTQDKAKSLAGRISRDNLVLFGLLAATSTMMILFILMPLWAMLTKSVQNSDGEFVGLANFASYFSSSSLWVSVGNTFTLGLVVTAVVGILAFGYAYALTRSCMPLKGLFQILGTAPILAPSLLPAISLIFLFGNQGIAKELLGGHSVYGVIGISMGLIFWTFPHALMILTTSLRTSDARLYEAARALKTSPMKTFFMVTLPAAKYGLISTLIVVFTLVITDFGVPKVIGGSYNVLATDIFKQVVGQQNFAMGAVTSIMLLFPAVMAFGADRWVQKKQKACLILVLFLINQNPAKRAMVCVFSIAL